VIFAEPLTREPANLKAVRQILEHGGRVLSTGFWGAFLLPGEAGDTPDEFNFAACKLDPEGLDALAGSGEVWMVPQATWRLAIRPFGWTIAAPVNRPWSNTNGQRARGLVGQFHSAGKRLARPRPGS